MKGSRDVLVRLVFVLGMFIECLNLFSVPQVTLGVLWSVWECYQEFIDNLNGLTV